MPQGKQQRKSARKQRKAATLETIQGLTTTRALFPDRWRGTMFYDYNTAITCTAYSNTVQVFRANSVHDPDFSGTGTTAAGYAQASALYQRYRVVSLRAIIRVNNLGAAPLLMNVSANNLNTLGTGVTVALAQRHVYSEPIGPSTGMGSATHTVSFPMWKIWGVTKSQVMNEDNWAAIAGTTFYPNNQVFLHIGFNNNDAAAGSVLLNVRIEYDTIWSLPINMPY